MRLKWLNRVYTSDVHGETMLSTKRFRPTLTALRAATAVLAIFAVCATADACTYVRLIGVDGSSHPGRTMEWGSFDLKPGFAIIPRGGEHQGMIMPDGKAGASWTGKYGYAGVTLLGKDTLFGDVINEKGLVINLLYLPGFAEYLPYDPAQADQSLSPTDFMTYVGSQAASVAEVEALLEKVRVVSVVEPALGIAPPLHFVISDVQGNEIVVEYVGGELHIHEGIGVMTNSPAYDWHLTNLRNHINLRQVDWKPITVDGLKLDPIGVGTGLLGVPGDFTPPSRFVRAAAYRATSRKTTGGYDTTLEQFRILDSFQLPLESDFKNLPKGLDPLKYSSTLYTVSIDTKNMIVYYHTDDERAVRSVDLEKVDWDTFKESKSFPLRRGGEPRIEDVTPDL